MRTELATRYYESPEYLQKVRARADRQRLVTDDPLMRQQIIMNEWAVDPIRFIEDVCLIKFTEFGGSIKPFFPFEYQKDIVYRLQEAERSGLENELLIDKPRAMGITWIIAAYLYWRWLFTPNWSGFILSRTETEVDDSTDLPDNSIFGKFRFFIKYTPEWLLPQGFEAKGKKGTSTDSSLRLVNPEIGSSLIGSSTNSNAGRSRRYSLTLVDECFAIERFSEVWRALQSVSMVKVFVSTVKQGRVYEEFKNMVEANGNYISLSWKNHPFRDQQWYDEQLAKAEFDPEVMKEIEVDYSVNQKSQYYPEIRQATVAPLNYIRGLPLYTFLDVGKQDLTVIGWGQFDGKNFNILECYANSQKPMEFYLPFMNPDLEPNPDKYNSTQLEFIKRIHTWDKPRGYFGEQAHFVKVMPLNTSTAQFLFKHGIRLIYNQYAINYAPRRNATAQLLPRMIFNKDSDGAMRLYDAIANSRYTSSVQATSKDTTLKPVHDPEIADYRAALENFCVNIGRVLRSQRDDIGDEMKSGGFAASIIKSLRV